MFVENADKSGGAGRVRAPLVLAHLDASPRTAQLLEIVAEMSDLNNPHSALNEGGSQNLPLAIHEEDSTSIMLWAQLDPFLREYAKRFPQNYELPENEINDALATAMDEPVFFLTQYLIKRHLRKQGAVGLSEFATVRFQRYSPSWEWYKGKIVKEYMDNMRDLQLWNVHIEQKKNGAVKNYEISAGQALIDFHEFVFVPVRVRQYINFYRNHLMEIDNA
jgi:hypothetical protein